MKSKITKIIFWIYNIIMLLFYFRILPKPVNLAMSRELVRDMREGGWQVYNLVPFSSYSEIWIDPAGNIMRIIWHIAMFAVLAFLLSAAFENMPLKKRCALLLVYALLPEVVQALQHKDTAKEQKNGTVYAAASIVGAGDTRVGVVLIVDSLADVHDILGDIGKEAYLLLGTLVLLVLIVMVIISKVFTEPVKNLIDVIRKMSEGHFEQRAKVRGIVHNEIVDLAISCNQMADQLEKVESSRQQFVSNVSHELKTPLSSVKVLSESILLQEDVPKEMYVEFLHDITSEVDRMTAIINDLLTLVKLDQKEIPLNFKETNLTQMMTDIIKRLQPMADAKHISLQWDASKEIHAEADEMKLSLAISNLVDNAVKYTPEEGTVKVSLDADHQNVFISVADTGIGIPEDEVNRIFERFYRVDKTRDRETGGTGLGLSITHSTIMMHKGSIKVNSKEEEGTTILVRIPLKQPTTHG